MTRRATVLTMVGTQRKSPPRVMSTKIGSGNARQIVDVGAGETFSVRGSSGARERELPPSAVAAGFLAWLRTHDLVKREWAVDDVWFLAEEDFAPALGFALPRRRVFLGALQRLAGVSVTYDRRVYDRHGRVQRKTTFYAFAPTIETAVHERPMALAA